MSAAFRRRGVGRGRPCRSSGCWSILDHGEGASLWKGECRTEATKQHKGNRMRWFLRSLVALFVVWAIYLVSPYVAFYRLAKAVEAKDLAAIKERVNFRAVRISLSRQIVSAYAKATGTDTAAGSPVGQIAVSAGTAVVDPLIAPYVTPEAIIDLLTKGQTGIASSAGPASPRPAPPPPPPPPPPWPRSVWQPSERALGGLCDFFFASEAGGFLVFFFSLPVHHPPEDRFRLLFRQGAPIKRAPICPPVTC